VPAASTEPAVAAPAAVGPVASLDRRRRQAGAQWHPPSTGRRERWARTVVVAALICFVTFYATGGLSLETMTSTEMALTCASAAAIAAAVLLAPAGRRAWGLWSLGLLLAFTTLTALSVVWSVQPDESWQDAGRMFAYCGVFAAAIALVRIGPSYWPAVIGGVALAAVIVCGYALLTEVFPGQLAPASRYARLDQPYGYWNAIGLTGAIGAICCMWLGARRTGHALLSALAYPAMGLLLLTLVLAYSRGALAALLVGLALWFCLVPLRLRGAAVLIVGGLGAGAVAAWTFSTHALSSEGVALGARATAGHRLGALVVAMVLVLALAGVAIGFFGGRRAPSRLVRRRAGAVLLALIVLGLVGFAGALAHSHRGFTGSISHAVDSLTNPNAKPPPNTAGRLTAVASVRARYWKEALEVFDAHPALGAGAMGYHTARKRYRTVTIDVTHAHGFVVQTLADLGVVGLVAALALLACWMAAAGRATHPLNRRWSGWREIAARRLPSWRSEPRPYSAERIGLLTMLCAVAVFGVHSLVDWTWYVPGNACVALLFAGWLAGRGPLEPATADGAAVDWANDGGDGADDGGAGADDGGSALPGKRPARRLPALAELGPLRVAVAVAVVVAALLAAWSEWQPQRSEDARQQALALVRSNPRASLAAAQTAVERDRLSAQALFTLSAVQQATGDTALAQSTLQRAVRLQPSNPETWMHLGLYELSRQPRAALNDLEATIYLDPQSIAPELITGPHASITSIEVQNAYIQALRASTPPPAPVKIAPARRGRAGGASRRAARRPLAPGSARSESPRAVP
jgi:O-antigen ligase/polysaccharide polymerase Wzy-like membrane protein